MCSLFALFSSALLSILLILSPAFCFFKFSCHCFLVFLFQRGSPMGCSCLEMSPYCRIGLSQAANPSEVFSLQPELPTSYSPFRSATPWHGGPPSKSVSPTVPPAASPAARPQKHLWPKAVVTFSSIFENRHYMLL